MTRSKAVFISNVPPHPPVSGGMQRSELIVRALERNFEVHLALVTDEGYWEAKDVRAMRERFASVEFFGPTPRGRRGPWSLVRPLRPALVDRLAHNLGSRRVEYSEDPGVAPRLQERIRAQRYDLLVGRYLVPACRAGLGRQHPTLLDVDDVDTTVYRSRLNAPGESWWRRAVLGRHLRQLEAIVPAELGRFDHLWVCSEADLPLVPPGRASVLPNIAWMPRGAAIEPVPANPASREILVVASWNHPPNIEGLDRFLDRSWDRVRASVPDAKLILVGARMSADKREAWGRRPGVQVVGFVDSVADAYASCAFSLSPVFTGGGTKIKVLESLWYDRTVVVAAHSHRGYETTLPDGRCVLVGRDDEQLADACIELLRKPERRVELAAAGREAVQAHYSFEAFAAEVDRSAESVMRAYRDSAR